MLNELYDYELPEPDPDMPLRPVVCDQVAIYRHMEATREWVVERPGYEEERWQRKVHERFEM